MTKIKELDEVYDSCIADGYLYNLKEADPERAKTFLENAEHDIDTLKEVIPIMEKMKSYNLIWSSRYEIIRQLIDGILLMEKIKSDNHQCLFAYVCIKHKDWDIDWETIETMRLLRNRVHYDGRQIPGETWKEYKLKFDVYTRTFIKILKEKLKRN